MQYHIKTSITNLNMKKIIGVFTIALFLAAANTVSAQGKFGHINA